MSKAIECLSDNLRRVRAAQGVAEIDLDEARSALSAAQAKITSADETIRDIEAAIVALGGTVGG